MADVIKTHTLLKNVPKQVSDNFKIQPIELQKK